VALLAEPLVAFEALKVLARLAVVNASFVVAQLLVAYEPSQTLVALRSVVAIEDPLLEQSRRHSVNVVGGCLVGTFVHFARGCWHLSRDSHSMACFCVHALAVEIASFSFVFQCSGATIGRRNERQLGDRKKRLAW
jgi:hypothetical protein